MQPGIYIYIWIKEQRQCSTIGRSDSLSVQVHVTMSNPASESDLESPLVGQEWSDSHICPEC